MLKDTYCRFARVWRQTLDFVYRNYYKDGVEEENVSREKEGSEDFFSLPHTKKESGKSFLHTHTNRHIHSHTLTSLTKFAKIQWKLFVFSLWSLSLIFARSSNMGNCVLHTQSMTSIWVIKEVTLNITKKKLSRERRKCKQKKFPQKSYSDGARDINDCNSICKREQKSLSVCGRVYNCRNLCLQVSDSELII